MQEGNSGQFIHLHLHTEYSLLDGAARIDELFKYCKENNMPAVAMTDHGVMYGAIQFWKTAQKYGVKPIFGCEMYLCSDMSIKRGKVDGEFEHLVLLAKNKQGYKNLIKLDSLAFVDGFYYKPRIDMKLLRQHSEGLICLSACLAGGIPHRLMQNDYVGAKQLAEEFIDIFGKDDFYIELQDHGLPEQKMILPSLMRLARELGLKTVATNDVHYVRREDAEMQDVLLCIQTQKTLDDPTRRLKFATDQFYAKTYDEMSELFSFAPESISTTLEIAEKCNVEIEFKMDLIPNYVPPNGMKPNEYLKMLMDDGLKERYEEITDAIAQRADYEYETIKQMGYVEYYLIVWDFINYARSQNIPVGAGRGSGVGSIIAYAVGITNVDPLKYSLLFERFLNPERVSMPDFDIDFCTEGRGKVVEYVREKYGSDNVAQIATFGTMKAKGALKDVARVYNMPYAEADKMAKLFPNELKMSLKQVFGLCDDKSIMIPELSENYQLNDNVKRVVDMAIRIENMPRNVSMHAAGVIICKHVISDYVPLSRSGEDITTQFVKDEVEELGLLKMDFLGLNTLTDIDKTLKYIEETDNVKIDFSKLGYEDKNVYDLISTGETDAVFQLEGNGMKRFMRDLRPENLEDIIAGISLYRPGPMSYISKYVEGKRFPDKVEYITPELEDILNVTYGVAVYQEQVMQIVQKLAGFSLGQADIIRRIMSKKKAKEMEKQREIFLHGEKNEDGSIKIEGAVARGINEEVAKKIFGDLETFAAYAFNKSHAAAYAVLAYQTGYLKRYYPVHFLVAVINNRITKIDDVKKYLIYAREKNIPVYAPDVNRSKTYFSVYNGGILFGLAAIKAVGTNVTDNIISGREKGGEYKNFDNFLSRVDLSMCNRRMVENMIKAGAFDSFGKPRAQLAAVYDPMYTRHINENKVRGSGQFSLFDLMGDAGIPDFERESIDIKEFNTFEKLMHEKDVLGVYVTGHPLDDYRNLMKDFTFNVGMIPRSDEDDEVEELVEQPQVESVGLKHDTRITAAGLVSSVNRILTRAGKEMCVFQLEDLYGSVEVLVFPKIFSVVKHKIIEDAVVRIEGKLMVERGEPVKISLSKLELWNISASGAVTEKREQREQQLQALKNVGTLQLSIKEDELEPIQDILESYAGNSQVIVIVNDKKFKLPMKVKYCPALSAELKQYLFEDDIKYIEK